MVYQAPLDRVTDGSPNSPDQPVHYSQDFFAPVAIAAAAWLLPSCARAEEPVPAQQHSISFTGGSGLSMGGSGGSTYTTRTPGFVDIAWRTWHNTTPQWVTGFSLRAEVDGRTSVGVVPRFEFSRAIGRFALRSGLAAVVFFAPFQLAGPEASLSVELRLGAVVSVLGTLAVDVFFLGNDLPPRSVVVAANGAFGVAIRL